MQQPSGTPNTDSQARVKPSLDSGFEEEVRRLFEVLTNGLNFEDLSNTCVKEILISPLALASVFKDLSKHHFSACEQRDLKLRETTLQIEELRHAYARLESEYQSKFEKDKLISLNIPEKDTLKVKEESDDSNKSFRPEEEDNQEEVKRKVKERKDQKLHEKVQALEVQNEMVVMAGQLTGGAGLNTGTGPSPGGKLPQMGLPPHLRQDAQKPAEPEKPSEASHDHSHEHKGHRHSHGARCCHDHNHLLIQHHGF